MEELKQVLILAVALTASLICTIIGIVVEIFMSLFKAIKNLLIMAYLKILDWIEEVTTVDKGNGPLAS